MKNFFSVLRGIQSDVKFITLYNYVRVVLCHPSLSFYRLMQIYQNGISQEKKKVSIPIQQKVERKNLQRSKQKIQPLKRIY